MKTKPVLEIDDVELILAGARREAEENGWVVSIAVVDDGGHLLGLTRLDGAAALTAYMASEKGRTAALGRKETKVYEDMINQGRYAFLSAPLSATLEGGVPIVLGDQVVGAVGVSGVKSDQDAQIAKAGIVRLGTEVG
ncbi:hypothetical protein DXT88_06285 [Herbaspirillum lusitanum]|uniref:CadX n=1 Tax=Pseudomonas putida TaxID=303 RepID=H9A576_PSEPU|nr:heme-binding protein [Herbaspirillum lusitanum]AFD29752.1 CadX [Pseudomonas putida]MCW5297781.1 hypothetical protein [Herbaspirillum lusitanum]